MYVQGTPVITDLTESYATVLAAPPTGFVRNILLIRASLKDGETTAATAFVRKNSTEPVGYPFPSGGIEVTAEEPAEKVYKVGQETLHAGMVLQAKEGTDDGRLVLEIEFVDREIEA